MDMACWKQHTPCKTPTATAWRASATLMLRSGGIVKPILLLEGFFSAEDLPVLVANNIETAVHSIEQLEALELAELARSVPVWMKLDTGMHRLGCAPNRRRRFISACAPAATWRSRSIS